MADTPPTKSLLPLLRRLLECLSLDWITKLWVIGNALYQAIAGRHATGLYEILVYDAELELLDAHGKRAVFRKRQRVKFLQDHVIAFEDFAWGEDNIFAEYHVAPGVEADRYQEGDRWNVLISLRETKQRGDIEDFYIERVVKNGFTKSEEWQQAEIRHKTLHLKLSVIFPEARPCRRAVVRLRRRNQVIVLGSEHFRQLPDGRQILSWETSHVRPLEVFTLRWQW